MKLLKFLNKNKKNIQKEFDENKIYNLDKGFVSNIFSTLIKDFKDQKNLSTEKIKTISEETKKWISKFLGCSNLNNEIENQKIDLFVLEYFKNLNDYEEQIDEHKIGLIETNEDDIFSILSNDNQNDESKSLVNQNFISKKRTQAKVG